MINDPYQYDLLAIGVGPANLSLAALLYRNQDITTCFFESKSKFSWHPDMLFDFSRINVGLHKDLVSLVDPTNPYSFMNYLIQNNMQYEFFNASFNRISRFEFDNYYRWAANLLPNIYFNETVTNLSYDETIDCFNVKTTKNTYKSKRIVLGTGIRPKFPAWFDHNLQSDQIFHGYHFLSKTLSLNKQKVMIVGGGQSAAEVLAMLLKSEDSLPAEIYWVTSKGYPVMLDENPFANEIYTPAFSRFFYAMDLDKRAEVNQLLKDTSDGIHSVLLETIYQRLFYLIKTKKLPLKLIFIPLSELCGLEMMTSPTKTTYQAKIKGYVEKTINHLDRVIFCTGHEFCAPSLLKGLKNYYGNKIHVNHDFSIQATHRNTRSKLFLNNGAKAFHGPADPNLSLLAWRSAVIINAAFEKTIYHLPKTSHIMEWGLESEQDSKITNTVELETYDEY